MEETTSIVYASQPQRKTCCFKAWLVLAATLFFLIGGVGGYYLGTNKVDNTGLVPVPSNPDQVACTMDAKLCPDGTSVGRTGPNCEFAPCPSSSTIDSSKSDWKIYKNEKYSFMLEYPTSWHTYEGDQIFLYEGENPQTPAPYQFSRLTISEEENQEKSGNIELWWNSRYLQRTGEITTSSPDKVGIIKYNNLEFLQARIYAMDDNVRYYLLSSGSKVLTLTFSDETKTEIINQILSTFRFTE